MSTAGALARRWLLRAVGLAGAILAVLLPLIWFEFDPDPVRLALLVSLAMLAYWTILDALLEPAPPWWVHRANLVTPVGADQRLGRYAAMVEDHLVAQHPNDAVRRQLLRLASAELWQHHGLTLDDPRATALVGEDLVALLHAPERRFTIRELQVVVAALEGLAATDPHAALDTARGRKEPDAPAAPAR